MSFHVLLTLATGAIKVKLISILQFIVGMNTTIQDNKGCYKKLPFGLELTTTQIKATMITVDPPHLHLEN